MRLGKLPENKNNSEAREFLMEEEEVIRENIACIMTDAAANTNLINLCTDLCHLKCSELDSQTAKVLNVVSVGMEFL